MYLVFYLYSAREHCGLALYKLINYYYYLRFNQKKSSECSALWLHDGILVNSLECMCKYGSVHIDKPLDTPHSNKLGTSRQIDRISLLGRRPLFITKFALGFHYDIGVRMKWPTFCRQHFQMHFLESMSYKRQAVTWTSDDPVQWRINVSLVLNVLKERTMIYMWGNGWFHIHYHLPVLGSTFCWIVDKVLKKLCYIE